MTTVTLKRPVEHDGKTYTFIEVDEPTVAAIEASEKAVKGGAGKMGETIALLTADSGWPEAAIRKIRFHDILAINEAYLPFLIVPESGGTGG